LLLCGFNVTRSLWRDSKYDGMVEVNNETLRIEIKSIGANQFSFSSSIKIILLNLLIFTESATNLFFFIVNIFSLKKFLLSILLGFILFSIISLKLVFA